MIVKISKRDDPYARIDNRVLSDKELSYRARGILAYLLSKPNDWTVRPEEIINNGKEGRDAIRAAFRELSALGYARLVNTPTGREWHVFEEPKAIDGLSGDGPQPEKAKLAKSGGIVTKEKSTNERARYNEQSEQIFTQYPRKVGKPKAIASIRRAVVKFGFDLVLDRTKAYAKARAGEPPDFTPFPATWFNQERFNDDPSTWKNGNGARFNPPANGNGAKSIGGRYGVA